MSIEKVSNQFQEKGYIIKENYLDKKIPSKNSYSKLIKFIKDRPGHDLRYSIDSTKINKQLNWIPKITFEEGLISTINWYLENKHWLKKIKNLN